MINKNYFQQTNYIPDSRYNLENNNVLKITYMELHYGNIWDIPGKILEQYKEEVLNLMNKFCLEHMLSNHLINIIFDYDNIVVSSFDPQTLNHQIWYESYYD